MSDLQEGTQPSCPPVLTAEEIAAYEEFVDDIAESARDGGDLETVSMIERFRLEANMVRLGLLPVPPCTINGEAVKIWDIDEEGPFLLLNNLLDKIATLAVSGLKRFTVNIPPVTARMVAAEVFFGQIYDIETGWQDILGRTLDRVIFKKCGLHTRCAQIIVTDFDSPVVAEIEVVGTLPQA